MTSAPGHNRGRVETPAKALFMCRSARQGFAARHKPKRANAGLSIAGPGFHAHGHATHFPAEIKHCPSGKTLDFCPAPSRRSRKREDIMELLILWIALGVVTALAAQARGRSFIGWLVIGCLTGVFGLIAVLVMENLNTQPRA